MNINSVKTNDILEFTIDDTLWAVFLITGIQYEYMYIHNTSDGPIGEMPGVCVQLCMIYSGESGSSIGEHREVRFGGSEDVEFYMWSGANEWVSGPGNRCKWFKLE